MNRLFGHTSAPWVRYNEYEYREAADGSLYITPIPDAVPKMYSPMKEGTGLILDMLNIGMEINQHQPENDIKEHILRFVSKYGLLGFITALPTTPKFIEYERVYLPKNHFIKEEAVETDKYLDLFFPFEKLDFRKKGKESTWSVTNETNGADIALLLATQ